MVSKIMHYLVMNCARYIYYYKRIIIASVCAGISVALGIVLLYYNPHDSSFLYYSSEASVFSNPLGRVGSHCAALLTYLFGGASLILIFLLLLVSYIIAFNRPWRYEWDRAAAFIILLSLSAALMYGYSVDPLSASCPGGYCGIKLWGALSALFDPTAGIMVLFGFLFMATIIIVRFPYNSAFYYTERATHFLYTKRYIVMPLWSGAKWVVYIMVYPLKKASHYLYRLCAGTRFAENDESIASFEENYEEGIEEVSDDEFWHVYQYAQDQKQDSLSTLFKEGDNEIHHEIVNKSVAQCKKNKEEIAVKSYQLPHLDIFIDQRDIREEEQLKNELEMRAKILEEKLERFGVCGHVTAIKRGPVVTLFEYQPHIDTKLSKIIALEDDLAMALQALSIRIIAPIPGRSVVGFEVANSTRKNVMLGSVIQSKTFRSNSGALPLILGCDTVGNDVIVDLARMPHLLIAGSTGSGKSVALNSMLISLLCQRKPDELRLILIDPKRLEFASYTDIAHLLFPIITHPKQAILALKWVVKEMEKRYDHMKQAAARNIFDYNAVSEKKELEKLPFIVIIIDELSDLMITTGHDIEDLIVRITQMARAAGIHMLVATQRPSVDVITGLIKVNFPSRISFRVTSKVDSRTILDCSGAEKLLGRGDMLFLDAVTSMLKRVHGTYVSDAEIEHLVSYIREQAAPEYCELTEEFMGSIDLLEADDQLYHDVTTFLEGVDEVSISLLQRRFRIGYNRSARIIEILESEGLIAPSDGGKLRKVIHH